ncbi:MAG: T9SS type A sorting domain-containing protein [Bacteroidetes bacterium]|nr:T9SS type A sorting domain-containing protein [Bacteroidota bacterium]
MKTCYTLLFILAFSASGFAQNYYISNTSVGANDANPGTIASPWKSFTPLNALLKTTNPIDTIFLRSGDVFRDHIDVANRKNIVITSYGSGAKPVISGTEKVSGWTSFKNYYRAAVTGSVSHFFSQGHEQIVARYQDRGAYLTVDMADNNSLQDNDLSAISTAVLNRSQVCVHTAQWCWEKSKIASATSNRINYATPTLREPTAGYGYFLYGDTSFLNIDGEYVWDSIGGYLYFMPPGGMNPNALNCEVSVREFGISMLTFAQNISISNISFFGQSEAGITAPFSGNTGLKVTNCEFKGQYKYGIELQCKYAEVSNCYFREVDAFGIFMHNTAFGCKIHHNTFRNNGAIRNSGIGQEINLTSIKGAFVDSCHVHHNDIDSAGYCGISMDGKYNLIERNIVKHAMLYNNDGAALKSFGIGSAYTIFRNNIVSESDGNTEGTPNGPHFVTPAIYFDFSTNHCIIENNTIYNMSQKGIFLNASTNNNTVTGNVIHGLNFGIDFNGAPNPNIMNYQNMTGMRVTGNSIFAVSSSSYILRMLDNTGNYSNGTIDSNYYFQPYDANHYVLEPPSTNESFDSWKNVSGHDLHTKSAFVQWTNGTHFDTLFVNPTDNEITVNLPNSPYRYLDLDSTEICGSFVLKPYTSRILLLTNTTCEVGIERIEEFGNLVVYPNPAHESIHWNNAGESVGYLICDLYGRFLINGKSDRGLNVVYVEDFVPGIYFIRFENGGVQRFLVN